MTKYLLPVTAMVVIQLAAFVVPVVWRPPLEGLSLLAFTLAFFPVVRNSPRRPPLIFGEYLMPDGQHVIFSRYAMLCVCAAIMYGLIAGVLIFSGKQAIL